MRSNHLEVRPLASAVGAEIGGVDLSADLPDGLIADLKGALARHGVIVFRDQILSEDQHIAAARRFGDININRFFATADGHPEIALVVKEPEQTVNIGGGWHTDHSYDAEPALGSMLFAREVPPIGGDTMFASMYAAYDALSDGLKETLSGMRAVHSSRHVFGTVREGLKGRIGNAELATQDAVHPVTIVHPESGLKALYVNPGFTVRFDGWTVEESAPLLGYLYRHAARPEFTCRLQWRNGSLAFWDNRSTWHYALNDYQGERRLMHRITIEGGPLH
ncbi:MAG: TauD/TfdA family dioxygenase [Acetobacteraceae bacterium]|nr:TauD/TfdA family dioxygenase [Acetobacteraceae bacterium]